MAIRVYKPTSPARRFMSVLTFEEITKKTPEKSLLAEKKQNAGRNNQGRITVRHRGGGNRVKYRIIDFKRNKDGIPAKVVGIKLNIEEPGQKRKALVIVEDGKLLLAMGKKAANFSLASKLTGWDILLKEKTSAEDENVKYYTPEECITVYAPVAAKPVVSVKPVETITEEVVEYVFQKEDEPFKITLDDDGVYNVSGPMIKKFFDVTDFSRDENVKLFARRLRNLGVDNELRRLGVKHGDLVCVFNYEFEFID